VCDSLGRRFSTYGPWPSSGPWRCFQWATELFYRKLNFYHKLKIACYNFLSLTMWNLQPCIKHYWGKMLQIWTISGSWATKRLKTSGLGAVYSREDSRLQNTGFKSCNWKWSHSEVLTFLELLCKKCWRWQLYALQAANDLSVNWDWSFVPPGLIN